MRTVPFKYIIHYQLNEKDGLDIYNGKTITEQRIIIYCNQSIIQSINQSINQSISFRDILLSTNQTQDELTRSKMGLARVLVFKRTNFALILEKIRFQMYIKRKTFLLDIIVNIDEQKYLNISLNTEG